MSEVIDYLQSNTFAEKEARVNLDMKKSGEKVVVIKEDKQQKNLLNTSTGEGGEELDSVFMVNGLENAPEPIVKVNSQKWWDYFFSVN